MKLESLDELPESLHGQFEKVEEDGKTYYQDKDALELKNLAFNVKNENKSLKDKMSEYDSKFSEIEASKAAEIEAAKQKALEDAKTSKDVEAIEKQYQEMLEDARKRAFEEGKTEATKELSQKSAEEKAASLVDKISLTLTRDKEDAEAIADIIRSRVKVDPDTGKNIFHDAKGGALSVDYDGFIDELKSERKLKRLIDTEVATTGGGLLNGSGNGGGAPSNANMGGSREERKAAIAKKFNLT